MFSANRDILIRTLALLFAFAWFVRSGAQMGTAQLAGNEVLLQFITVAAFVLDSKWGLDQGFDQYYDEFDIGKTRIRSLGDVARRAA